MLWISTCMVRLALIFPQDKSSQKCCAQPRHGRIVALPYRAMYRVSSAQRLVYLVAHHVPHWNCGIGCFRPDYVTYMVRRYTSATADHHDAPGCLPFRGTALRIGSTPISSVDTPGSILQANRSHLIVRVSKNCSGLQVLLHHLKSVMIVIQVRLDSVTWNVDGATHSLYYGLSAFEIFISPAGFSSRPFPEDLAK